MNEIKSKIKKFSTVSFICGIAGAICTSLMNLTLVTSFSIPNFEPLYYCIYFSGVIFGVTAIGFASAVKIRGKKNKLSNAGFVLGVAAVILWLSYCAFGLFGIFYLIISGKLFK